MMNTVKIMATAAAVLTFATTANAQTTAQPSTMPPQSGTMTPGTKAPPSAAAPTTTPSTTADGSAAALTSADVSDGDVNQFATAVLAVQKVQEDNSIAATDKQSHMADAVKQAGLTPDKFNSIARASQADPALMKRIQTAAAAQVKAGAGGASTGG
jgi:hypothetical protein